MRSLFTIWLCLPCFLLHGQVTAPGNLDILITEFMADPTPKVGLPDKEFVELKNRSDHQLDLTDCILTDGVTQAKLPKFIFDTGRYLIICSIKDTAEFKVFGDVLGLTNFPSLNNDGDLVSLRTKNQEIIYEVNFKDSWYRSQSKKEGGYTLEMINTGSPCTGNENWIASQHFSGGTPGFENSVSAFHQDTQGPKLLDVYPLNENEIRLSFDEALMKPVASEFALVPSRLIRSADQSLPDDHTILLTLNESLEKGVKYWINIRNVADCLNNSSSIQTGAFALTEEPVFRDLVWSEVLFNPYPGGADFIEIYNRSSKFISLNGLLVKNNAQDNLWYPINTERVILPGEYLALCAAPDNLLMNYPKRDSTKIIEEKIPLIDDAGGSLQLAFNQNNSLQLLDSFTFVKEWHHPFLHDVEGVSLEKINLDENSGNRSNWQSAAASAGFATPGLANSQHVDTARNYLNKPYSLSSQIISPNGDSYRDYLTISFDLKKSGYKSRIEIFDLSGQMLKAVAYQLLSAQDFLVWNGEDDLGSLLPIGNYILYIELIHPEGDHLVFKERITVDH